MEAAPTVPICKVCQWPITHCEGNHAYTDKATDTDIMVTNRHGRRTFLKQHTLRSRKSYKYTDKKRYT